MTVDFFEAFKRTEKQIAAWKLLSQKDTTLLYGGSRSGKTVIIIFAIIFRALAAPKSYHLILRKTYKDCRTSIFNKTLQNALDDLFPRGEGTAYKLNRSDSVVTFPNGSQIFCNGLDENRIDSVLGNEYATIYYNEISEIMYSVKETVDTRLAQTVETVTGKALKLKTFLDCNPPKKAHWAYKVFFQKINPEDRNPLPFPDDYGAMQLNPHDNEKNLPPGYIEKKLGSLSKAKKKRFLFGEFGDDTEGALWKQKWIDESRAQWNPEQKRYIIPDMDRMVVAIDPAVTSNITSDENGIITIGMSRINNENHYYVMSDVSGIMRVEEWARTGLAQYDQYEADKIVGEVNNGGDLVERNVKAERPNFHSFEPVRASRGKAIRAEPIATLTEKGYVHFVGMFPELEEELTSWVPGDKSPNRLDAMVWGITWLMGDRPAIGLTYTF